MARIWGLLLSLLTLVSTITAQHFAVTGTQDGVDSETGARPARRNILDLATDTQQWSLYIQALTAMQQVNQNDQLSYYQVSGIHGLPYDSWDGVVGDDGYTQDSGYCTHDSCLFPSWHRPFCALFEARWRKILYQILHGHAVEIAQQYTGSDADSWQESALQLRGPFWDWATDPDIPSVVTQQTTTITGPDGQQSAVPNPFYQYTFNPLNSTDFPSNSGPLSKDKFTVRSSQANGVLENDNLQEGTYNLLTHVTDYLSMSTQASSGSSIESLHNLVHSGVGGNTNKYHMAIIDYSQFDPLFMTHHFNVDRIFAMWLALYPDSRMPDSGLQNQFGTYTIPPGTQDVPDSSLTPFSKDTEGTPWTTPDTYSMVELGYTYPEITDWNLTQSELQQSVTAYVQKQWSGSSSNSKRSDRTLLHQDAKITKMDVPLREWFVYAQVPKLVLKQSFMVYVFIGSPPESEEDWPIAPNLVGSLAVILMQSRKHAAMAGSISGGPIVHGEWIIGSKLAGYGVDPSDVQGVVKFLTENLLWVVIGHDGTVINVDEVKGLLIEVEDEVVIPPDNDHSFPIFGQPTPHPEITRGKPGGYDGD